MPLPAAPEPDPPLDARLGAARPQIDPFVERVLRANAARRLFGVAHEVTVGRYRLRRLLGGGGGGSVFVAHDPELDRELAIKLIAASDPAARARAVAEGQSLGRLAHPNVVAVFDVGVVEDRVFLAMELVQGRSLRDLAVDAPLRDLVRAYRQAGEGLMAAHARELVHGDFKPDNAMVGSDGRVRVVDFGLAGAVGAGMAGGTPLYQAPEVVAGAAATPALDQYAFAVALREAVTAGGRRPAPRWLSPIVARGSNPDPARRYPSMAAMLQALARDPRARWRRRGLVAVPLTVAVAGFLVGRGGDEVGPAPCGDGVAALAPTWSPARATALQARLRSLGTPFADATAETAPPAITAFGDRWREAHRAVCAAERRGLAPALSERRAVCLERVRGRLDAALTIVGASDPARLADALRTLAELPDPGHCVDAEVADDALPPAPAIAPRVAAVTRALDRAVPRVEAVLPDAVEVSAAVVTDARQVGYPPLVASALLNYGRALQELGRRQESVPVLREAGALAITHRLDAIAVEAFARELLATPSADHAAAQAAMRPFTALAQRLGPRDRFAAALLYNHAGVLARAIGQVAEARAAWTTALELARHVDGPGAVELAWVRANLAMVSADADLQATLRTESLAVVRARLGADHPLALDLEMATAFAQPAIDTARSQLRRPCQRLAALHPHRGDVVVECGYELAILDLAAGAEADAGASFRLVVDPALRGELDATRREIAAAFLMVLDGDPRRAATEFARIAATMPSTAQTPWYLRLVIADVELGVAMTARRMGDRAGAAAATARAIGQLETAQRAGLEPAITRRLAWARP